MGDAGSTPATYIIYEEKKLLQGHLIHFIIYGGTVFEKSVPGTQRKEENHAGK